MVIILHGTTQRRSARARFALGRGLLFCTGLIGQTPTKLHRWCGSFSRGIAARMKCIRFEKSDKSEPRERRYTSVKLFLAGACCQEAALWCSNTHFVRWVWELEDDLGRTPSGGGWWAYHQRCSLTQRCRKSGAAAVCPEIF